jgi:transposase-like protein
MLSEEFRKAAVQKYLSRGSRHVQDIAREVGVSSWSLYQWSRKYATTAEMKNAERRPQDWSAAEKFKAVMEFERLLPDKQGEFLRRKGLHSDHIEAWKKNMQAGLEAAVGTKASRAELVQLRTQNKELGRDLNKKDKALAEVTALLVLKKKADLLWGTGENE